MRALPALLMLAISLPAPAQVYKWTDADGRVHYSDKPVSNGEPMRIPKTAGTDADARTRLQQFRNQLEGSSQIREEEADASRRLAAERQADCERTRANLRNYEEVGRIVQVKDDKRVVLDHRQKDAAMAEIRQFLGENCE
jgi:hypothetical protein